MPQIPFLSVSFAVFIAATALADTTPAEIVPRTTSGAALPDQGDDALFQEIRETLDSEDDFDATDDEDWLKFLQPDENEKTDLLGLTD